MDEEDAMSLAKPSTSHEKLSQWTSGETGSLAATAVPSFSEDWHEVRRKSSAARSPLESPPTIPHLAKSPQSPLARATDSPSLLGKGWSAPLPSTKLDMKDIMAQASSSRTSALSTTLSVERAKDDATSKVAGSRLSQKERKKQQQQYTQKLSATGPSDPTGIPPSSSKSSSPWQTATLGPRTNLKDVLDTQTKPSPLVPMQTSSSPIPPISLTSRRTASPDTRFAGQSRKTSDTRVPTADRGSSSRSPRPPVSHTKSDKGAAAILPRSVSYTTPTAVAEPSLQLSMADIIGQQRREQDLIKEAVAKRSLQEIQEEQAFQEWWDQESRRTQEEEARKTAGPGVRGKASRRGKAGAQRGRGSGRGKSRGAVE